MKNKMIYQLGITLLLFISFSPLYADEAFVLNYFNSFSSMKADFKQTVQSKTQKEVSSGILKIRKKTESQSAGFNFDYTKPYQQKIISDGNRLWHYDVDLMQVVIKKMSDFERNSPMFVIFGQKNIDEFFTIKTVTNERKYLLTPKTPQAQAELKSIELQFSKGALTVITATEVTGQKVELLLSNVVSNTTFSAAEFSLTPPKGVDVIDETK